MLAFDQAEYVENTKYPYLFGILLDLDGATIFTLHNNEAHDLGWDWRKVSPVIKGIVNGEQIPQDVGQFIKFFLFLRFIKAIVTASPH